MLVVKTENIENGIRFKIEGANTYTISEALEKLFLSEGYRLEFGNKMKGSYGVGNEILRLFLGAFVKRFRFNFEIKDDAGNVVLDFMKDSLSKYSGGIIGYKKLEIEFSKFVDKIKAIQI